MSYRELVLLQRPSFYIPFEEASGGTASDVTGNGFDGTYNNVSLASASGFSVYGGAVTRATWNGTNSYVSIAKRWQRGGAISFSAWYKPSNVTGRKQLFNMTGCNNTVASPCVYTTTDRPEALQNPSFTSTPFNGSNVFVSSSVAASQVNAVVHLALVMSGQVATMYVNGASVLSNSSAVGSVPPSSPYLPMLVGAGYHASNTTPTDFYAGWISNLAAWDRPLSSDEVLRQYNVGKSVFDQPYISGTVLDNGVGVAKRIKWMRRDSGILVAAGSSASDGSFALKTTSNVGMAVCLDDAATSYSPLIFDRVTPQT